MMKEFFVTWRIHADSSKLAAKAKATQPTPTTQSTPSTPHDAEVTPVDSTLKCSINPYIVFRNLKKIELQVTNQWDPLFSTRGPHGRMSEFSKKTSDESLAYTNMFRLQFYV